MLERRWALPWIRRGDYADVKRMMEDRNDLGDTYDDWLKSALEHEGAIVTRGDVAERVMIEPWEFEVWCAAMALSMNNDARLQFAAENASCSPLLSQNRAAPEEGLLDVRHHS